MAVTVTLIRSTPFSVLYLVADSVGGALYNFLTALTQAQAIPDSPLAHALAAVRTDTAGHAIADLFEGPPIGALDAGGGVPGTGFVTDQNAELRCRIDARASAATAGIPDPVSWALTADVNGIGGALFVFANNAVAACDAYLEVRLAHSQGA